MSLFSGRCFGVGYGSIKTFVLISDQNHLHCCVDDDDCVFEYHSHLVDMARSFNLLVIFSRINKRGSQKDMEQKKAGNYFFYDEDDSGSGEVDDDDL